MNRAHSLFFYDPILHDARYILGSGFDTRISAGALFEILLAICNIATAIVIFPIVKRVKEAMALGYVASRIVEAVISLAGVISLMSILTLGASLAPSGDTDALTLVGRSFLAFHDWTFLLGPQFCAGFGNGLLLGYLMYQSQLVPRRLALLGLVGGPLAFLGGVLVLFDALKPMSAGLFTLTAIEIAWELSIIIYAIARGFRPSIFSCEPRKCNFRTDFPRSVNSCFFRGFILQVIPEPGIRVRLIQFINMNGQWRKKIS